MAARRKLFLTHAGELAHRLVSAIARDAMAMEFVRGYASRHERLKLVTNAERLREMESTISREALLLIAAEVQRLLPRAFGLSSNSDSEDRAVCDLFCTEFLEALGRAMNWPIEESDLGVQGFRRDLEMYTKWRERNNLARARTKLHGKDSPFPDRCAILLDSAMMEQARRAAAQFQAELLRFGTRIFGQLGSLPQRRVSPNTRGRSAKQRGRERAVGDRSKQAQPARRPGNRGRSSSSKGSRNR
jgi:hypothetical protein